jgi:phosphoribosylaminoimidazole-succinocarboxamide synthase
MVVSPDQIRPFLTNTLERTDFPDLGERYEGKVRDVYEPRGADVKSRGDHVALREGPLRGTRILIATDRQSAFDINWCTIPLKGQVLNQLSAWWFEHVRDIMPTHVLDVPDPNAMVVKKLTMLKVEIVVRAYLTGSTKTSAWVNYERGVRNFCGNALPDGMRKNQKLETLIVTPTTKAKDDELLTPQAIIERGLASEEEWKEITGRAFALFERGQKIAAERGLILVDTKYEMGFDERGVLTVADEVHTPDSSRYWVASTYEERFKKGQEPEALDKEFFRLWVRGQGFDPARPEETRPTITDDVRLMLAAKYIDLYERMTGESFRIEAGNVPERIEKNLARYRVQVLAS